MLVGDTIILVQSGSSETSNCSLAPDPIPSGTQSLRLMLPLHPGMHIDLAFGCNLEAEGIKKQYFALVVPVAALALLKFKAIMIWALPSLIAF